MARTPVLPEATLIGSESAPIEAFKAAIRNGCFTSIRDIPTLLTNLRQAEEHAELLLVGGDDDGTRSRRLPSNLLHSSGSPALRRPVRA